MLVERFESAWDIVSTRIEEGDLLTKKIFDKADQTMISLIEDFKKELAKKGSEFILKTKYITVLTKLESFFNENSVSTLRDALEKMDLYLTIVREELKKVNNIQEPIFIDKNMSAATFFGEEDKDDKNLIDNILGCMENKKVEAETQSDEYFQLNAGSKTYKQVSNGSSASDIQIQYPIPDANTNAQMRDSPTVEGDQVSPEGLRMLLKENEILNKKVKRQRYMVNELKNTINDMKWERQKKKLKENRSFDDITDIYLDKSEVNKIVENSLLMKDKTLDMDRQAIDDRNSMTKGSIDLEGQIKVLASGGFSDDKKLERASWRNTGTLKNSLGNGILEEIKEDDEEEYFFDQNIGNPIGFFKKKNNPTLFNG